MANFRLFGNGCELIDDTSANTGKEFESIYVREDTVITTLTGGNKSTTANATNYLTSIGLSGVTLVKGDLITAPIGEAFKSITLSSGSIIGYGG
jgi:hypothetical protein